MYTIKKRTSKRLKQNGYMYTDNKSSFELIYYSFKQHTTQMFTFEDITASFKNPKKSWRPY